MVLLYKKEKTLYTGSEPLYRTGLQIRVGKKKKNYTTERVSTKVMKRRKRIFSSSNVYVGLLSYLRRHSVYPRILPA